MTKIPGMKIGPNGLELNPKALLLFGPTEKKNKKTGPKNFKKRTGPALRRARRVTTY